MYQQHYQTLFAYSAQTAQTLLEKAALLPESELQANPGYGHGSIFELFFHLLNVSQSWRVAFETGTEGMPLHAETFPRLEDVRRGLVAEYTGWQAVVNGLSDEEIASVVTLTRYTGEKGEMVRWRALEHVILHAMQHHTEIAQLLTQKGQSPGDIDFLFYRG